MRIRQRTIPTINSTARSWPSSCWRTSVRHVWKSWARAMAPSSASCRSPLASKASAMTLTVVRAGPTVWCSSTAASVILRRVSCTRSALRFISYFRGMEEIITQRCAFNLDSRAVVCHRSLHTVVQGKEKDTMAATEDQAPREGVLDAAPHRFEAPEGPRVLGPNDGNAIDFG